MLAKDDLYKYIQLNKIDLIYIDDSSIIQLLYNELQGAREMLIVQNMVFYRNTADHYFVGLDAGTMSLSDILKTFRVKVIGLVFEKMPVNDFSFFSHLGDYYYYDISPIFSPFIFQKNEEERFRMRCSAALTEKIIQRLFTKTANQPYDRNHMIHLFLAECGKIGVGKTHINVMQINAGSHMTPVYSIDCGISYYGFFSDITRLFCYDLPEKSFAQRYAFLIDLQNTTAMMIRENMHIKDLFLTLNRRYHSNLLFRRIENGFGHGVGQRIHEGYSLCSDQKWTFQDGLSFTLEPILSVDNTKLRIENMYEVKNGKASRINKFLSDSIIVVPGGGMKAQMLQSGRYYTNPDLMLLEREQDVLLANLNCDSLARGKKAYLRVGKSIFEMLKTLKRPCLLEEIKKKYPNDLEAIDLLISEELLIRGNEEKNGINSKMGYYQEL